MTSRRVEEAEATDELNIPCSLVNHFEVDEDINIEIQHSRRRVVPMWFWEKIEENFSPKLNQLLQAVNPYFWKEIPSFSTVSALVPSQTCPLRKQDAGIVFPSHIPGSRARGAAGERHRSSCAAAKSRHFSVCASPLAASFLPDLCVSVNVWGGYGHSERCQPWEDKVAAVRRGACRSHRGFPVHQSASRSCLLDLLHQAIAPAILTSCCDFPLRDLPESAEKRQAPHLAQKSSRQLAPCLHPYCAAGYVAPSHLPPIRQVLLS